MSKGQFAIGVLMLLAGALVWLVMRSSTSGLSVPSDFLVPLASYHERNASLGLCVQRITKDGADIGACPPAFAGLYAPPPFSKSNRRLIRHQISTMSIHGDATFNPIFTESGSGTWHTEYAIYDETQAIKQPIQVKQNMNAMAVECMSRDLEGSMVIGESIGCVRYRNISQAEASGNTVTRLLSAAFGQRNASVMQYGSPKNFGADPFGAILGGEPPDGFCADNDVVAFVTVRYLTKICKDFRDEVIKATLVRVGELEAELSKRQLDDIRKHANEAVADGRIRDVLAECESLRRESQTLRETLDSYGAEIAQIRPLKEANERLESANADCRQKLAAVATADKGTASEVAACNAQAAQLKTDLDDARLDLSKLSADVERFKNSAELAKQGRANADKALAENAGAAGAGGTIADPPPPTPTPGVGGA